MFSFNKHGRHIFQFVWKQLVAKHGSKHDRHHTMYVSKIVT